MKPREWPCSALNLYLANASGEGGAMAIGAWKKRKPVSILNASEGATPHGQTRKGEGKNGNEKSESGPWPGCAFTVQSTALNARPAVYLLKVALWNG